MSTKTMVVIEDDVEGGEAAETVAFALDGVAYTIDLNDKNAAALREAMAPWIGFARKSGRPPRAAGAPARTGSRRKGEGRSDLAEVRAWGKEHGYAVSERGRLSGELQQAYDAAHA